ncbi:MAG: hypothetical protein CMN14_15535 [Roseobacter sp.]|nr:hypothetical protein [Roseobacter sp.]|tara:strand:+ start:391 stop:570 length:180 start_codon:yes stop_codon:yes gene_type:complete
MHRVASTLTVKHNIRQRSAYTWQYESPVDFPLPDAAFMGHRDLSGMFENLARTTHPART